MTQAPGHAYSRITPWWTGAVSGALSGLLGVGGAVILVPLMTRFLGLTQHQAHGTSLAVVGFTALAALAGYARHGHVDILHALPLIVGAIVGSPLGAHLAHGMPSARLRRAFGIFLVLIGLRLLLPLPTTSGVFPETGVAGFVVHVTLGFFVGALSGFFGVGGGVVLVPLLALFCGVPQHVAQGISLVFVVPTAIAGGITHARLGNVVGHTVAPLAIASAITAFVASFAAAAIPGPALRAIFGLFMIGIGLRQLLVVRKTASPPPAATKTN